jgi:hypothetical protein
MGIVARLRSLTFLGPRCCSEIDPPRNRISDVTSSMAGAIASGLGTPVMFVRHAQSTNNPVYEGACALFVTLMKPLMKQRCCLYVELAVARQHRPM